jgi:predicted transcriptional regulator
MYSNKLLAKELGVDESLIEQMIIQLKNMGHIEKDNMDSCSPGWGCGGHSKNGGCCGSNNII